MAYSLSFASLVLLLVLGFMFRRTLKMAADELPEAASDVLSSASAACKTLNENVLTLAAENAVDVRIRAKEIARKAEEAEVSGVDITALYSSIIGKK